MRESGSHFYGEEKRPAPAFGQAGPLPFEDKVSDSFYLSTGRQAIRFCLLDAAPEKKTVLLPSYTCHSVIQPFIHEGYSIQFYPVDEKLGISMGELARLSRSHNAGVLLFHPYFGFDSLIREGDFPEDVTVIYDATQSFFSDLIYPGVDYIISSIRKWGPFTDGAFAGKIRGHFTELSALMADEDSNRLMRQAFELKRSYLAGEGPPKEEFLEAYRKGFTSLGGRGELFRMDPEALALYRTFDFSQLAEKRRANYRSLLAFPAWGEMGGPLFEELEEKTVPLYFPFRVGQGRRAELQAYLAGHAVYAPVIWPKPATADPRGAAEELYRDLLALPIDQRYGPDDMERIKAVLKEYVTIGRGQGIDGP